MQSSRKTPFSLLLLLLCFQTSIVSAYFIDEQAYYPGTVWADDTYAMPYNQDCCAAPNCGCDGQNLVVSGSFLYWQLSKNLSSTIVRTDQVTTNTLTTEKIKNFDFKPTWKDGYRVALETPINFNACSPCCWTIGAQWTDFTGSAKCDHNFKPNENETLLVFFPNNLNDDPEASTKAKIHSKMDLSYRDFSLWIGRTLCWDCFSLRPFIGFEYLYTLEKLHSDLNQTFPNLGVIVQTVTSDVDNTGEWHSLGGSLGLEAFIDLDCGFTLEAYGAFDGLYGKYKAKYQNLITSNVEIFDPFSDRHDNISTTHSKIWNSRFVAESRVGIHWRSCYESCSIDASVGWEYIYLFRGLRLDNTRGVDVALQGLTATLTIGF